MTSEQETVIDNSQDIGLAEATAFLTREACFIDQREWDAWIGLFDESAWFWVPCWLDTDRVTENPDTELSLIYCDRRIGLEERIGRLRSGRSIASLPLQRTLHMISNVQVTGVDGAGAVSVLSNAVIHSFSPKTKKTGMYFARYEHLLRREGSDIRITGKKIILLNDYLPSAIDIYTV